jgi:hypothetical protein
MARRGKKKSLARRIRRLVFLASAGTAIVKFAMARRPKTTPSAPQAPEWAPLRTPAEKKPVTDTVSATDREAPAATPDWIAPVDGACPLTHPVKGKTNSNIYHVPGGRFYDSSVPDRCYRDEAAAEADGMRASKR